MHHMISIRIQQKWRIHLKFGSESLRSRRCAIDWHIRCVYFQLFAIIKFSEHWLHRIKRKELNINWPAAKVSSRYDFRQTFLIWTWSRSTQYDYFFLLYEPREEWYYTFKMYSRINAAMELYDNRSLGHLFVLTTIDYHLDFIILPFCKKVTHLITTVVQREGGSLV